MKTLAFAALVVAVMSSSVACANEDLRWSADALPSVVNPPVNTAISAWEPYKRSNSQPSEDQYLPDPVLKGAIDIHAHFGPDTYNRQWDVFEIARRAEAAGMRGIVIKSHWTATADLADLARKHAVKDLEVWGGLALNTTVGGINPMAVRAFGETSGGKAKVVWMPTHDSEHEVRYLKQARPFVRVSHEGVLLPQVIEVLDLIANYNLTLATGHVTPEEMLQIVEEATKRGIDRIIITHPGLAPQFSDPTVEDVQRAVAQGAYAEVVASELFRPGSRDDAIALIRTLGPEHCILSTDSGIVGTPNHADALALAAQILREAGFSDRDLALMAKINPARVLGLDPA